MERTIDEKYVRDLLAGSAQINLMKEEIDATVSIVSGLITEAEFSRFKIDSWICTFEHEGLIVQVVRGKPGMFLTMELIESNCRMVYSSVWGASRIPMLYVQMVHKTLPQLLLHLMKKFPELETHIEPLLQAAS
ncbi:MAG: hypothetical protein Q8R40_06065 [bacterium]|nr:hypothetical protein [bacterium]